jgi:pilus assembly protein Flp/PilA
MEGKLTIVRNLLVALHRDDSGQDLIEYALIAALIALGSIIGMDTVANEINSAFNIISQKLSNAVS